MTEKGQQWYVVLAYHTHTKVIQATRCAKFTQLRFSEKSPERFICSKNL